VADSEDDDLDLELAPADAGALFRAEMWATNTLLGYWKHLVAVLIVALLGFLFWGQYTSNVQRTQRGGAGQIAEALSALSVPLEELPEVVFFGETPVDKDELEKVAGSLESLAGTFTGIVRVEAHLKAAELYRLAGDRDAQRASLESALDGATGVLKFSAVGALANLELEVGEHEAAAARLQALVDGEEDFFAQQAALDLGLVYEAAEQTDAAAKVYEDFLTRWPDSEHASQISARRSRLSGAG